MSHRPYFGTPLAARVFAAAGMLSAVAACGGSTGSGSPTATTPASPTSPTAPTTRTTPTTTGPVATNNVVMKSTAFTPPDIQVSPGATVTFSNQDNTAHNVTFSGSTPSIGQWTSGDRTVQMTTTPGTYPFQCTLHSGMTGSVLVK